MMNKETIKEFLKLSPMKFILFSFILYLIVIFFTTPFTGIISTYLYYMFVLLFLPLFLIAEIIGSIHTYLVVLLGAPYAYILSCLVLLTYDKIKNKGKTKEDKRIYEKKEFSLKHELMNAVIPLLMLYSLLMWQLHCISCPEPFSVSNPSAIFIFTLCFFGLGILLSGRQLFYVVILNFIFSMFSNVNALYRLYPFFILILSATSAYLGIGAKDIIRIERYRRALIILLLIIGFISNYFAIHTRTI